MSLHIKVACRNPFQMRPGVYLEGSPTLTHMQLRPGVGLGRLQQITRLAIRVEPRAVQVRVRNFAYFKILRPSKLRL